MKKLFLILVIFLLSACGGVPVTKERINNAQFGAKPSEEEALRKIRSYLESVLTDPDSLRLKCLKVTDRAWARGNMFDEPQFGYLVICDVNAKNRMGGYTGGKEHAFLFNGSGFNVFDFSYYENGGAQGKHYDLVR